MIVTMEAAVRVLYSGIRSVAPFIFKMHIRLFLGDF
jgi:hypothetical protein